MPESWVGGPQRPLIDLLETLDEEPSVEPVPPIVPRALARSRPARCGSRTARCRPTPMTHAHDLDYEPDVWVEQALEHAREQRGGRSARAITNQMLGFRAERARRLDGEVTG
jgi:hypothetical protein